MAAAHLGETIDIHGGGQDLVFPHHENEIAQSTCAHGGRIFARHWMHNGLVHMQSEKMSKSLGNVLLLKDLLGKAPGEAVRLALLTAHYRQPLDWSEQLLADARAKLDRMYGALREAGVEGRAEAPEGLPASPVVAALEDDLNTPRALAELFTLARAANRAANAAERHELAGSLRAGGWLLGLLQADPAAWFAAGSGAESAGLSEAEVEEMVNERDALRRERKYREADRIRDRLAEHGIVIEDRTGGSRWRRAR
jgi:cysteinyl-tRNA synthetase